MPVDAILEKFPVVVTFSETLSVATTATDCPVILQVLPEVAADAHVKVLCALPFRNTFALIGIPLLAELLRMNIASSVHDASGRMY